MELLEGNDLERELELTGPLPVTVAVDYVLQAIDAVAEAHASGVVHRDLKPTNLFLMRRSDGSRSIKVLDFGISKLLGPGWGADAALTRSASIFGSPLYMAPEQMRSSKDVDVRADIWSLGAILYELIAGRPPYVAESMPALCVAIMTDPPYPLAQLAPATPPELEAVLLRCLAREPLDRYATVAELASALAPFTPNGQVHSERARRLLRHSLVNPGATTALLSSELFTPVPSAVAASGPQAARGAPASVPAPTQSSWGKTGGRAMASRRNYALVGALVFVGAVAGAFVFFRSAMRSSGAHIHSAVSASAAASPGPPAAVDSGIAAGSTSVPAAGEAAPIASTGEESPPAPSVSPQSASKSAKLQRTPASPPRSAPPHPKATKDAGLTDFGGRLY